MSIPPPTAEFLTPEESAQVDQALLSARDRFSVRVAIYALRSLQQIADVEGQPVSELQPEQVKRWIVNDQTLNPSQGFDEGFKEFFSRLVVAALKPLQRIADSNNTVIRNLVTSQVIEWFEAEAKQKL